ncbi:uncharacterized protein LOC121723432 [Alosa sapidissima]|uniref:uncharacterized protein LOC121723432 n=1 Tax=Alosa sapidissima TaxID=34773 RepID=UPI001C08E988|nr:uncharacterized protein LOC121723432 [Alosa sapidissima]
MSAVQKNKSSFRNSFKFMRRASGSNDHCCVPQCSASSRYNSELIFHKFPKDSTLRAQWVHEIRRSAFTVTPHTKVCSRHFESHQIMKTDTNRRVLVSGSVPSLFEWNNYSTVQTRPGVWERCTRSTSPLPPEPVPTDENLPEELEQPVTVPMVVEHDYGASPTLCVNREVYEDMVRELEALREQLQSCHLQSFGLQRFSSSPEDIRYYTRFPSYRHLMAFWDLIEAATTKMVRVTRARKNYVASTITESPLTRPTKLLPIDELFLFLTYLSTGCTQRELGHRFNIHRTTVSRIIVTWANFLYSLLGSICIWMSPTAVKANLPQAFDGNYSDTNIILDCTELRCQTPSSLLLQSEVFSTYKSHCTFKAMVGMSP